jgi:hypothetical protein
MYVLEETVSKSIFVKKLYNKHSFLRCVSRGWFGLFGNCSCKILCITVEFNDVLMKILFSFTPSYVIWRGFEPRSFACRKLRVVGFVMYRTLCVLQLWTASQWVLRWNFEIRTWIRMHSLIKSLLPSSVLCFTDFGIYIVWNLVEFTEGSRSLNFPNPTQFLSTVLRQT